MTPEWMYRFGERLLEVTHDCRPDMHEPDEQGVSAVVTGLDLDNAMGDNPYENVQELTAGIRREDTTGRTEWFNLASLIALARVGARHLTETRKSLPTPPVPLSELEARIDHALNIIFDHGGNDAAHHKAWVIDYVVYILTGGTTDDGKAYNKWVEEYEEDGNYHWEKGIAP